MLDKERELIITYGFIANPKLSLFQNTILQLQNRKIFQPELPKRLKFHLVDGNLQIPPDTKNILGLGSKFCLEKRTPSRRLRKTFSRLVRSVRTRALVASLDPTKQKEAFNKKLYVKTTKDIPLAPPYIENCIQKFMEIILYMTQKLSTKPNYNLNKVQRQTLQTLRNNNDIIVIDADKNLGITVLKRSKYIKGILKEHLLNEEVYQKLNSTTAHSIINESTNSIKKLVNEYRMTLPQEDTIFFERSFHKQYKSPIFYGPPKLHKKWSGEYPKTRPVVAKVNSFIEIASKYIDHYLSFLIPSVKSYLKDSFTLLEDLKNLPDQKLHPKYKFITADAISMYTNIHTGHGINTIEKYINDQQHTIDIDFPAKLIIKLLKIVMENNVFRFGDLWFLQKNGTAMGTIAAVKYATIYFAQHEHDTIIPKYKNQMLYFRRYIDDIFIIWDTQGPFSWKDLENDLTYEKLKWETNEPSNTVDFLDLTIFTDKNNRLQTKTFEKPLNLHLYPPKNSCHPHGVARGLIIGFFIRYWLQNSYPYHFKTQIKKFARRLKLRGYSNDFIKKSFIEASIYLQNKYKNKRVFIDKTKQKSGNLPNSTLLYHRQYHPRAIPQHAIRDAFNRAFKNTNLFEAILICNSRPRNIRDILMPSDLPDRIGKNPSDYLNNL